MDELRVWFAPDLAPLLAALTPRWGWLSKDCFVLINRMTKQAGQMLPFETATSDPLALSCLPPAKGSPKALP